MPMSGTTGTNGHLKVLGGRALGTLMSTAVQITAPPISIKGTKNRRPFTQLVVIDRLARKIQAQNTKMSIGTLVALTSGRDVRRMMTPALTKVNT